jgi:GntR family transcriptional regulator
MLFRVDPASPVGLAEQIAAGVRGALVDGELQPGERLPPAREVAAGLDVNVHTVLRGYAMLRDEGLIELRRRRGAQIRPDLDPATLALHQQIRGLAEAAGRLGWTADDLAAAVRRAMA